MYETAPATALRDCESVTVIVPVPVFGASSLQISVRTFEALFAVPANVSACATPEVQDTELTVVAVPAALLRATVTRSIRFVAGRPDGV